MDKNMVRTLALHEKDGEALVGEQSLIGLDPSTLRRMFGFANADPMVDAYPVGPEQAKCLQPFKGEPIDLDRFDYFVECHAETSGE